MLKLFHPYFPIFKIYKIYKKPYLMSSRKYSFYRGSLDNLSFDVSPIGKN